MMSREAWVWAWGTAAYLIVGLQVLRRHARAMEEDSPFYTSRFWRLFASFFVVGFWPLVFRDRDLMAPLPARKQDWSPRGTSFYRPRFRELPWS